MLPAVELPAPSQLKFREDKTFKIVAFGDVHWNGATAEDQQTLQVMETILAAEAPDLVIYTGDNCTSGTLAEVRSGYQQFTAPVVRRGIPWAATLGNHDAESGGITRKEAYQITLDLPGNISRSGPESIHGYSNYVLPVMDATGAEPAALLYVLDSNAYVSDANFSTYDWVHQDQIQWYCETAAACRQAYQKTLPACMFFHIPLPEINGFFERGAVTGVEQETPCPSEINGGLWAALRDHQDIMAVFNGHDHINDFIANLGGLWMGYVRGVSYHTYGKEGYLKGARVILLHQGTNTFDTWLRLEDQQVTNRVQSAGTNVAQTPRLRGQWDFDQGDLRATVGYDLAYAQEDVRDATRFGTASQFGVPKIAGQDARIMQVPGLNPMFGYVMRHDDPGTGQRVIQYTLIFDLLYPAASQDKWRALLQTEPANTSDADFFINPQAGLGISGNYQGQIVSGTWYRVGLAVDITQAKVAKYINGEKVGEQAVDSRWSLCGSADTNTPYALLFADNDGEDALTYVNSIQYWSGCLTDADFQALGQPAADGLPVPETARIHLQARRQGAAIVMEWTGGTPPYRLQKKDQLSQPWQETDSAWTGNSVTNDTRGESTFYRVLGKP